MRSRPANADKIVRQEFCRRNPDLARWKGALWGHRQFYKIGSGRFIFGIIYFRGDFTARFFSADPPFLCECPFLFAASSTLVLESVPTRHFSALRAKCLHSSTGTSQTQDIFANYHYSLWKSPQTSEEIFVPKNLDYFRATLFMDMAEIKFTQWQMVKIQQKNIRNLF